MRPTLHHDRTRRPSAAVRSPGCARSSPARAATAGSTRCCPPTTPPAAIAALSPNEVFELVHEVGFEDAQPLIELATPAQIQGCFDLDGWNKDQLEVAPLKPWLAALIEVGFEKVGEVLGALDAELRALILQRQVTVYDTTLDEAPAEDSDAPIMPTPDRFFMLELHGRRRHPAADAAARSRISIAPTRSSRATRSWPRAASRRPSSRR